MDRSCRLLHGQPRQLFEWNYFPWLTGRIVLLIKKIKFEKIFSSFCLKHFPSYLANPVNKKYNKKLLRNCGIWHCSNVWDDFFQLTAFDMSHFHGSGSQFKLDVADVISYVGFANRCVWQLICIHLQLKKTPKEKL